MLDPRPPYSIAFIAPSLSKHGAGVYEVIRNLAEAVGSGSDFRTLALGMVDDAFDGSVDCWGATTPHTFKTLGPRSFGYAPGMGRFLDASKVDLVHLHSLWMYTSVVTSRWGRKNERPYVVSPNGMLESWALKNSKWKKQVALALYDRDMLRGAACIHVNDRREVDDVRSIGLRNPVFVLHNGVKLHSRLVTKPCTVGGDLNALRLTFLGRIHPKKGLVNLLYGLSMARASGACVARPRITIAGLDEGGHLAQLKDLCSTLGLKYSYADNYTGVVARPACETDVAFIGPVYGEAKAALFEQTDIFVLPSYSEGQPIAVLEAMSAGLPIMLTRACNLGRVAESGCALIIEPEPADICRAICQASVLSRRQIGEMGCESIALIDNMYNWEKVSEAWVHLYLWLLGDGPVPDTIVFD